MIVDIVEYELDGSLERSYESNGLRCDVAIPLAAIGSVAKSATYSTAGVEFDRSTETKDLPQRPSEISSRELRILVVEDNSAVARLIHQILESAGCIVVGPAASLERATVLAEQAAFDAALLDVDLNGERVYPLARDLARRDVPFALLTGFNVGELPEDLAGKNVFSKPVGIEALHKWLEHLASTRDGQ
jgi:CheY-like chemotaxis protein